MEQLMPLVRQEIPLSFSQLEIKVQDKVGLIIVDVVNGFCSVGHGNLAPPAPDTQIANMVQRTCQLAKDFSSRGLPMLLFLDTHEPNKPEPPYPPHCIRGTGEEKLVPELVWLENDPNATLLEKDCINGFIGGIRSDGSNFVQDWVAKHQLQTLLVVGICTNICVMEFVLTALSARNHGILAPVQDVVVLETACSTYNLPRAVAEASGRGATASHPQELTHYMGLYCMYSGGAVLVNQVQFAA